ncbi:glycosyltransferase family 2 protein [Sphingobium sp. D43FB]|uniref:glycosyltransferase family 2 protein n=1 Tax=Sphingobium sp. D43FB TaxID=2017595 RepID=UPI000BB56A12|nr:glycosyltransferase family 2 protein [Sphingobium sp. D43FB]PBN41353.1 hypothetical protein SxD43FB_22265 [Sphingobium sp. D43FB]
MITAPPKSASWTLGDTPLISVIVPSYNHQDFIYKCIDSINSQSYENIELIFIDDCSVDETYERAFNLLNTPYGRRFKRIDISKNAENLGAHDTINLGISRANGTLVTVINSDDEFHPERISAIVAEMKRRGASLGFSLVEVINDAGTTHSSDDLAPFLHFTVRQMLDLNRDVTAGFGLLRKNLAVSTGNIVFTKALYDAIGGFLPLKYCHDWDFVLQALFYGEPAVVQRPLYKYRLHPQNSFKGLAHLAEVETEVVLRRFFRRVVNAEPINPICPSPSHWPGYFQQFIARLGCSRHLDREFGDGLKSWRTYQASD